MALVTAGKIINDAAIELGLGSLPDAYSQRTANDLAGQLCQLLKSAGKDVLAEGWSYLTSEHSFTTVQGVSEYDLPDDYDGMIAQTGWNRTNRLPMEGPLTPQEWQYIKGTGVNPVINVMFRPSRGKLSLVSPVAAGQEIYYEYLSSYWVGGKSGAADALTPSAEEPQSADNMVLLDDLLMMRALKLAWLRSKNEDTTAAQTEYDTTLERIKNADNPSRMLNLTPGARQPVPLISGRNMPPTVG